MPYSHIEVIIMYDEEKLELSLNDIACTYCGAEVSEKPSSIPNMRIFVCSHCGHIELFDQLANPNLK